MISRIHSNTFSTAEDVGIQMTISYIRDFNMHASNFRISKTDEECMVLLNRSASILGTTTQPQHFNPIQLEVSTFFIDLHYVIGALPTDCDVLWSCIGLLQHCSRNTEARHAIIEEYRFVPLLTFILKRTQTQDKVHRLLTLMQDLTYGISIRWEEPYVNVLLQRLVNLVYDDTKSDKDSNAILALSVLINLCYKNFVVQFLFLRSVNMSTLNAKVQNYGMLANKLFIILSDEMFTPDKKEMHKFLRSTFATVDNCVKSWNLPHLRHIVEFLIDSKAHSRLHSALLHYENYPEDLERLLNLLEERVAVNADSNEDVRQKTTCLGLLFQLIRYILELSVIPDQNGSENSICLDSLVPRIFEILCDWIESEICGFDAVNLLDRLVRLGKKATIAPHIARDPSIIIQLIATTEKPDTSPQHCTAILQLLLSLLRQAKTDKLILSKITESYFDKVFAPAIKTDLNTNVSMTLADIEKSIFCLLLLINFASIAKKAYFEKCEKMLQLPQIQNLLARAMLSQKETICSAVFQISQFEHFPQSQVAKCISELNTSASQQISKKVPVSANSADINFILRSQKTFFSKEIEARLHDLIESILHAQRTNQLTNVATAQMIELFNYKIEKLNCAESSMLKRLDDASADITNLTHRISLQNAELLKYETMNFELHVNHDSMQMQCKDLKIQNDNLKRINETQMKKRCEQAELLQTSERRLSVKVSELIVLQKENHNLKEQLKTITEEHEKLQSSCKENATRIDALKKNIAAYEMDIKDKVRALSEKERDLIKLQTALDEQKDAKKKSDGVIAVLEAQLQDKNEQIRNYELEQSETEELRKTILSLMESKKPKRKV